MSDNLQNNPFAALFSSLKEAEIFVKVTQPSPPLEETSSNRIENGDEEAITLLLEDLLLITTRTVTHSKPRVFLSDGGPLNLENLQFLLFERLLLETPEVQLVGESSNEGKSKAVRKEVVIYLSEIYRRCSNHRDSPLQFAIQQVQQAVIDNLTTALEQPELYGGQKPSDQLLRILEKGLGKDAATDIFMTKFLSHLYDQKLHVPSVFEQLLSNVTKEICQFSLMSCNYQHIDILDFYASVPILAPLLSRLPEEIGQDRTGKGYHYTALGSLLSISCLPKGPKIVGQPNEFFEKPSSKTQQAHSDTEKSIWLAQKNINGRIYKLFYALLKISPESKDKLLTWVEKCLEANSKRAGLWHVQARGMPQGELFVSDGFMINLGTIMLQLAQPFIQNMKEAKFLKIDPTYCVAPRTGSDNGIPGAYTGDLGKQTTLIPSTNDSSPSHSKNYSFISSCFFLTHRALHLGIQVVQQKLSKLSQELGRLQNRAQGQGSQDSLNEILRMRIEDGTAEYLTYKAAIFEPSTVEVLMQFLAVSAEWLTQIALTPQDKKFPPSEIKEIKLPLPENSDIHYYLQCIPEFLVETLTETISAVRRYYATYFDSGEGMQVLPHFMSFIVVFMGSPERMNNPHLRAHLAKCLETLLPESSSGGILAGYREQLFTGHPVSGHIVTALIHVFVSIEMTGQSVAFEEKFNYRRPMYEVMKYLWESPRHKKSFKILAEEALSNMESAKPPLFLRFVNLLINDAIFLLDEGLSYMSQIREYELERDNEAQNPSPANAQQRNEREANYSQTTLLARFHNMLGISTIEMLIRLSKEIPEMFTHSTLIDRVAAMLNYFLSTLVGRKQRNLKVRDMEKYEFKPAEIVSNISTIYLNLYANDAFCVAVSADGRSYTPQLFSLARDVLMRTARGVIAEEMEAVALKVEKAKESQAEDEDIALNAPEEFLDPIMSHLMTDPVILPSSKETVDRQTIARHLLSDQSDPFNRQPLSMEDVIPNTELKNRITQWLDEQRLKRAKEKKETE